MDAHLDDGLRDAPPCGEDGEDERQREGYRATKEKLVLDAGLGYHNEDFYALSEGLNGPFQRILSPLSTHVTHHMHEKGRMPSHALLGEQYENECQQGDDHLPHGDPKPSVDHGLAIQVLRGGTLSCVNLEHLSDELEHSGESRSACLHGDHQRSLHSLEISYC